MAYTSVTGGVGDANRRLTLSKASRNYTTRYFRTSHASGDIRINYDHMRFSAAGSGEVIRAVAEAYATGSAAAGTINGAHITGRVGIGGTVSGALNAIRATLEVAGTTPTPGGTLAAIELDVNASASTTWGNEDAFIRITNSGSTALTNLLNMAAPSNGTILATHSTQTNTHSIKFRAGGVTYYIPCHATATGRG